MPIHHRSRRVSLATLALLAAAFAAACGDSDEATSSSANTSASSGGGATSTSSGAGGSGGEGAGGASACADFGIAELVDPPAGAGLSSQDDVALRMHLDVLAAGWSDTSVPAANEIMNRAEYDADDLRAFFDAYFVDERRPMTDDLWNYIGYPTFNWFDDTLHLKLQRALSASMRRRVEVELAELPNDAAGLGDALDADPELRKTLMHAHRLTALLPAEGILPEGERRAIFDWYAALALEHPLVARLDVAIDPTTAPWVAALRVQTTMAFTDIVTLDACDRANVDARLAIVGPRRDLWFSTGVLLHDNLGFEADQIQWISDIVTAVPPELHDLGHITQHELLGNAEPTQERFRSARAVNIFDLAVGAATENPFPPDVAAIQADIFHSVVAHEVNHIVDAHHIATDATLRARKEALIAAAGLDDLAYLRSMVGGAFFQTNPQEFVASISNQWFTDSAHTLELGLTRFDAGQLDPLNQVLFFMEVYALGGPTTRFYRVHLGDSALEVVDAPVTRNAAGRIDGVTVAGTTYSFELDQAGNVVSYAVE